MIRFSPDILLAIIRRWEPPGSFLVAYSGGGDSEVLLHAQADLGQRLGAPLAAAHVCHGLQHEAEAWIDHCRRSCERLGVDLSLVRVQVEPVSGESLEAVARSVRYSALAGAMEPGDLLVTAHHQDDQAETLLLQLLRGSGLSGLAAMPELAPFPPGRLGRPMLGFPRGALRAYAEAVGLDWVEDPSNRDLGRDRNFLRHRILPGLAERWPSYADTFSRSARHCAEAKALIDDVAHAEIGRRRGSTPGSLSIARLSELDGPRLRAVLRSWIAERGFLPPDVNHLDRVEREVLSARGDRNPLVAWRGCEIRRFRDLVFALPPLPPLPPTDGLGWVGESVLLPCGLGTLRAVSGAVSGIDPGAWAAGTLRVVFYRASRLCRPLGKDHRRTLKNLFQERGIPAWIRPYVPLILLDGELVAVGDLWVCESAGKTAAAGICVGWEGHPWPGLW